MDKLVRYDNKLVEAVYCFDLLEKKLMVFISLLYQNNPNSLEITTSLSQIEKEGISTVNSYREIKKALKSIINKSITIDYFNPKNPNKPDYDIFTILTSVKYKDGIIKLKINENIKPYLIELAEKYTTYHIENIKPLASAYSIRIYELLKMQEGIERRQKAIEYTITVEELRTMLGITTEYERYYDFKRKVLEQAKKDLKEKTDLKFSYKEEKLGRSVHKLTFKIAENAEEKEKRKAKKAEEKHLKEKEKLRAAHQAALEASQLNLFAPEEVKEEALKELEKRGY